jgi:putative endonuclease
MSLRRRGARLGRIGEVLAVRHLERAGWTVVARNWRAGGETRGELDVVAWDGSVLVFCEVKTRRGTGAGGPLDAVTPAKLAQLRRLATAFLAVSGLRAGEVRFDAVGVAWPDGGGRVQITHLRGLP